jgi:phosphate transport system substrate-binding protein
MKATILWVSIGLFALLNSCGTPNQQTEPTDTPTSGTVNISVDESYTLLFQNQVYTFQNLYERAHVNVRYQTEQDAINALLSDSCKVAVLNRDLTAEERKTFESKNIFPKTTKIAEDAIALIVHPENRDTALMLDYIKKVLTGEALTWPTNPNQEVEVVFDNNESTNARYMKVLINNAPFQKNCYAVKSNDEVINHVATHPYAMGIISVNWISDKDDTLSQRFLQKVKVIGLTKETVENPMTRYYKPYQAYVLTKDYPLVRDVFMINRQTRAGLGMGFVAFVAGEKGQRMIKLQGMVPASAPVRLIQLEK